MRIAHRIFSALVLFSLIFISCDPKTLIPAKPSDKTENQNNQGNQNKDVKVTGVTLDKTSAEMEVRTELTLVATVQPNDASNKKVTWSSSNTAIATVADGKVTAVAAGNAVITVKTEDGAKTATCAITVKEKPVVHVTGVTLDKTAAELEVDSELTLVATVLPNDANNMNVTWSSSDNNIATVTDGKVTAVAVGKAVITVKTEDGDKTATCEVTVKEKPVVAVTGVTLDKTTAEAEVNMYVVYLTLKCTVLPENATNKKVTWSSSNDYVATVSNMGVVSISHTGSAVITVKTEDGNFTASCTLTVKSKPTVKVTGIEMYSKTLTVKVGEIFDIAATISPSNATNNAVTWTPVPDGLIEKYSGAYTYQPHGNKDVIYKAKAAGKVTVTVKTSDGGFTDTCEVTITE